MQSILKYAPRSDLLKGPLKLWVDFCSEGPSDTETPNAAIFYKV
jgi:hypothetical protein